MGVDVANQKVICQGIVGELYTSEISSSNDKFELPYDYLVMAVGSVNNTFNTPGVEQNANFLKSIEDAQSIRCQVMDCFETASYPNQSEEEIKRLLSFVVVGGGPTGVEFAAELHDFFEEDLKKYFPKILPFASITIIQSSDHILNTYDKKISEYAEKQFKREAINVRTNARVREVTSNEVILYDSKTKEIQKIPFGVCVWSTGVTSGPLSRMVSSQIPGQQHEKAIVTDYQLKVRGSKNIYAIGDCATVDQKKITK